MFLRLLWQRMTIKRQNALCAHTWKVLLEPPLIRWKNLSEKDFIFWAKVCAEETSA